MSRLKVQSFDVSDATACLIRCIGDHPFKSDPSLPLEEQMVVCDPEVTVIARSDAGKLPRNCFVFPEAIHVSVPSC